ncbi:branched-chain amino acid ABC transporter permease [Sneathiella sp. P13V-1]|uniref:branched-chain amino acid ABC transporter permease n=1 Tax=Sneathiella sp. P13V-1 TaxID=2697366 RepID=UPI00187B118E|nr:branched-chain amino acid ABC transporter permease [Sneathiella sp. P13V-1]MBE7637258.1 branched-chain amino acid ABC transporter permease [Sneathiella sp. P13V-1]
MSDILIIAMDALSHILILVMVALGLMIIFGLMGVINMAHGELFMIGAYVAVLTGQSGIGFWPSILVAPIIVGFLGFLIEKALIQHIYHRPLDTILATWGLSIALKQAIVLLFGPESQSIPVPLDMRVSLIGFEYPLYRLVVMGFAAAMIFGCFWVFLKTNYGLMARAVISRPITSEILGLNTKKINSWSFVTGSALAGLAGAFVAPTISVDPQMGLGYLVPGFLSLLVGGTGPFAGVLVGGAAVGGTNSLLTTWISPVAAQVVVFLLALVVIRMRPNGILGGKSK